MRQHGVVCSIVAALSVVVAFAAVGQRDGIVVAPRQIVDRAFASDELAAFVTGDTLKYIAEARFRGVEAQFEVFNQPLQGFPLSGESYIALSTGRAQAIPGQATDFASTNLGGVVIPGGAPTGAHAYDVGTLIIRLDLSSVPAAANPRLSLGFKFMTEEVPTYVGSIYQDFFTIKAFRADGTYIGDLARLPNGELFTIDNAWPYMNQVGGHSQSPLPPFPNPNDVVFNGVTDVATVGMLTFDLTAFAGQSIILEFQIGDAGDEIFDSAVFLDGFQVLTQPVSPSEGEIWLGELCVKGTTIAHLGGKRFRVTGAVNINEFLWIEGELIADLASRTARGTGRVRFKSGPGGKALDLWLTETAISFFVDASVSPPRFGFIGAKFTDLGFRIGGTAVRARELSIYVNDPSYGNALRGTIRLEVKNLGVLELQGFYLSSKKGLGFDKGIEVSGLSLGHGIKLEKLKITYNAMDDSFEFEGELTIEYWDVTFSADLTILQGALESIGVEVELGTGKLVFPKPPLYLQNLSGSVSGLATGDIAIGAGFAMTLGPEVTFAGNTYHLLRMNLSGTIKSGYFKGKGDISIFWDENKLAGGEVTWWRLKGVEVKGWLNLADILVGELKASADAQTGDFRAHTKLDAHFPNTFTICVPFIGCYTNDIPYIGGKSFASTQVVWRNWDIGMQLTVTVPCPWPPWTKDVSVSTVVTVDPNSNACATCWPRGRIGRLQIGVFCNLESLLGPKTLSSSQVSEFLAAKEPYQEQFFLPDGRPYLITRFIGDPDGPAYFELVTPEGDIITPEKALADPDDHLYFWDAKAIGEVAIIVFHPQPGLWRIVVPEKGLQKAGFTIEALGGVPTPRVVVTEPSGDVVTSDFVNVSWTGNAYPDAVVTLFYTPDLAYPGAVIAEGQPLSGTFTWHVRGVPPGTYYVVAMVDDGKNAPQFAASTGRIVVVKDNPHAALKVPMSVPVGTLVPLDGSGSTDPWNSPLQFQWILLEAPLGSAAEIVLGPEAPMAYLIPDLSGTYRVRLCVIDPFGASDCIEREFEALTFPASLTVPLVGSSAVLGAEHSVVATLVDGAGNPVMGELIHFLVWQGPHAGLSAAVATDLLGKAVFSYSGTSPGVDRIRVWTGAESFENAQPCLRAEIGHVWLVGDGGCALYFYPVAPQGWHMLSLPGALCCEPWGPGEGGDLACALCDDLPDFCLMFRWDPASNAYLRVPPAVHIPYQPGMGFWTYVAAPTMLDALLRPVMGEVGIGLRQGWNQVGSPYSYPVAAAGLRVRYQGEERPLAEAGQWVLPVLYAYNPTEGKYTLIQATTGTLLPWQGLWAYALVDCELVFSPTAGSTGLGVPIGEGLTVAQLREHGLPVPPGPPTLPVDAIGLTVFAYPNPVSGGAGVVFHVRATCCVEGVRVRVHDLSGRVVWQDEAEGGRLWWNLADRSGKPVANGVYLYVAEVKVAGRWTSVGLQKLLVLR